MRVTNDTGTKADNINWDYGWEAAKEILESVQLLGTTSLNRVDGEFCKVYKAGTVLRVDIPLSELRG
jgi:hypothetical protein